MERDSNERRRVPWWQVILIGRNPKRTLVRIVILIVVCTVVFNFILLPIRVEGASMLPTYKERGVNMVNRLAYLFKEPQRGDVVAIRLAGRHLMFMKRIVALPGETFEFRGGQLFINGEPHPEPYVKLPCSWDLPPEKVGPGEYFVVGDNRSMAEGEHRKGRATRDRIVGRILL